MIPSLGKRREPPPRPRPGEVYKKIVEARRLLELERWSPADVAKMQSNFDDLGRDFPRLETTSKEDQAEILSKALGEIKPENYRGQYPPEPAREPAVRNQDMWEFRWNSPFFQGREMYVKFCFSRGDENSRRLFMLSLHRNRPVLTS